MWLDKVDEFRAINAQFRITRLLPEPKKVGLE